MLTTDSPAGSDKSQIRTSLQDLEDTAGASRTACTDISAMRSVLCLGLLSLLLATGEVYSKPSCTTEKNLIKDKEETSCVQLGLTSIPLTEIPKDTAILILKFNALTSILTSNFKGMAQLVELDLSDNALSSFKVDSPLLLEELNLANNSLKTVPKLSQLSSLTHLVLSNNHISTIPDTTFAGLEHLKLLELQKNEIDSLSPEVFKDLRLLTHLDLSYNKLWVVPTELISTLVHLEKLYLTGNKLTEIPDGFFDGIDNLAYVYLDKNPWNCNCALEYFKKWVEDNDFSVYQLSDGHPVNEAESVLCFDGTPLLHYSMAQCHVKGKGDMDFKLIPKPPKTTLATVKTTEAEPTVTSPTQRWPTTLMATTEVGKMSVTTPVPTTTVRQTSTMVMEIGDITTPITEPLTTIVLASEGTSGALRASERTTHIPNTTTYQTLPMTTSDVGTTGITTEVSTPTFHFHSTTKRKPSTPMTIAATSDIPTSVVKTVMMPTGDLMGTPEPSLHSMPPARETTVAAAVGMSWLAHAILQYCCILHLLIYALCVLLVLLQVVASVRILVWAYNFFYSHYKALKEELPEIRLIRYSFREPVDEGEILRVQNDTIESHFRDQSSNGVTRMLVIEADSGDHNIRCTSAIL